MKNVQLIIYTMVMTRVRTAREIRFCSDVVVRRTGETQDG